MNLYFAKVVDVHPEGNNVDVTLAADGRWLPAVPVVGTGLSGNTGLVDLPVPDLTTPRVYPEKHKSLNTDKRDILAIIGDIDGVFVCLGFLSPPVCEMNFPKELGEERRIDRHASDVYSWIDRRANAQWCHPNGSYCTLSEDPDKLDLTAKDYDKVWKIKRNLTRVVHFFAALWSDGVETLRVWAKPDGDTLVKSAKRIRLQVGGTSVTIDESGVMIESDAAVRIAAASVDIGGSVSIHGAVNLSGAVKINGILQEGS